MSKRSIKKIRIVFNFFVYRYLIVLVFSKNHFPIFGSRNLGKDDRRLIEVFISDVVTSSNCIVNLDYLNRNIFLLVFSKQFPNIPLCFPV